MLFEGGAHLAIGSVARDHVEQTDAFDLDAESRTDRPQLHLRSPGGGAPRILSRRRPVSAISAIRGAKPWRGGRRESGSSAAPPGRNARRIAGALPRAGRLAGR